MSDLFAEYAPDAHGPGAPADLVLRRAELRDVPAIARVLAARNGWDLGVTEQRTEHGISQPPDAGFYGVAETAGEVAAYARAARYAPPPDAPANAAPEGWYLLGVGVVEAHRRRGLGSALTRWRLARIARHADTAYYFASATNRASIDLHAALGFEELTRDFWFPALDFSRNDGVLFRWRA